ncbi:hypothetical protein ACQY1Q_17315 [Tenacibaculum sp. TC6]|uniref:hypothetical protein n=1 Tax=Tenacibaculum sp. TC6 TaxID=3423223 RepID=UPI003D35CEA2
MNKIIILLTLLFLFINCSSNQKIAEQNNEEIKVLRYILKNSSNSSTYYKTIINDGKIPINTYIKGEYLEFYLCSKEVDSFIKIPKQDILFLQEKFKTLSIQRLDKLLPEFKDKITKKKERFETSFISIPVLFNNNSMAIFYSLQTYGGEFKLLKKSKGEWKTICSNSVWIE